MPDANPIPVLDVYAADQAAEAARYAAAVEAWSARMNTPHPAPSPEYRISLRTGEVALLAPGDPRLDDPDWVDPDGRLFLIEDHRALYDLIHNRFGGDESEGTFRIPDLRDRPRPTTT